MSIKRLQIKKMERAVFSAVDGTLSGWVELKPYQNTVAISNPKPTIKEHYQAGKTNPAIIIATKTSAEKMSFQLMDADPDSRMAAFGGEVTVVSTKKTWHKADGQPQQIIAGLRITTVDDYVCTYNKGFWSAGEELSFTDDGIALIDVDVFAMETGFVTKAVTWGEV